MSTKIKDSILISSVSDSIKIPIGNYESDDQPYGVSVGQLKSHIDADKATVAVSGSYNDLLDKPDMNNYALMSTLNSNFYNKKQVNNLIGQIHGVEFRVVEELPPDGEEGVIYLVKDVESPEEQNYFDEYIWIPETADYERIGDTQADLSNYYTKSQVDSLIPSVSNAQITFTQGGVTKGTIRLNQSNGATIALDAGGSLEQVQTDWNETDTSSPKYILNKPTIPTVGNATIKFTMGGTEIGSLTTNQSSNSTIVIPETSQIQSDWNQSDNTKADYIKNKPTIPTVNNPTIYFTQGGISKGSITLNQSGSQTIALDAGGSGGGGSQVQPNWAETDPTSMAYIANKPTFATVATSGSYNDLTNKPTIGNATITIQQEGVTKGTFTLNQTGNATINLEGGGGGGSTQVQSNWTESDSTAVSYIQNKPTLATVATSGNYNDLANKPTIPAAQVNADWEANSGVAQILHRPVLSTVATSGSYADLSNKPTIPSNTRSLLITYEDETTETITVYTT